MDYGILRSTLRSFLRSTLRPFCLWKLPTLTTILEKGNVSASIFVGEDLPETLNPLPDAQGGEGN